MRRHALHDRYEPFGVAERQGLQQDRVDDAEDRGRRPDAQCEGEDGDQSEARRLPQRSCAMPQLPQEIARPAAAHDGARHSVDMLVL
jgi:hypothetical protein